MGSHFADKESSYYSPKRTGSRKYATSFQVIYSHQKLKHIYEVGVKNNPKVEENSSKVWLGAGTKCVVSLSFDPTSHVWEVRTEHVWNGVLSDKPVWI